MSLIKVASKIKKKPHSAKNKVGFTLIELLVVIGILGVLAAALLAAINPVEQLNKSQDTAQKYAASQFTGAASRYYTTRGGLPWYTSTNGGSNCYGGGATLAAVPLSTLTTCITALVTMGELKQSYSSSTNMDTIYVTNPNPITGSTSSTVVCFQPKSASQQKDPNTRFAQNGALGTSCKSQGGTNNCYWCEP